MKFSGLKSSASFLDTKTVSLTFKEGGVAEFDASDLPLLIAGLASGVALIETAGGAEFTALKVNEFTLHVTEDRQVYMSMIVAGARVPIHIPASLIPDLIKSFQGALVKLKTN